MALNDLDQNSRFEKSLGLLTTRFVNLLQDAEDGVLDLKVVSVISIFLSVFEKSILKVQFYISIFLAGRRSVKCEAKTTNIRHYKCSGGDRAHREEEQELYKVEGGRGWREHPGGLRQNLTAAG